MKSFLKGCINNGLTDVDCLVRDLSATSARLAVSGGITMPSVIDLHIPGKKLSKRALVQWRRSDEMGVSFLEGVETAPPLAVNEVDVSERLSKLEAEIVSLRKIVLQLRREVFPNEDVAEAG